MNTAVNTSAGIAAPERKKHLNRIILLFALAIVLNAVLGDSLSTKTELLKVGDHIPSFSVEVLGGGKVSDADMKGKPVVYFFYAEWCPCSHQSVPWIKKARSDYAGEGMKFVAIGIQDSSENLEKFAGRHQLDFPVSVSGGNSVAGSMGVKTTPTTIFADREGVVRSIFVGKIEQYEQIADGLKAIASSSSANG